MTSEGQRIEVRYQWSEEEFLRAHLCHWHCTLRTPFRWAYYAIGIFGFLIGVFGLAIFTDSGELGFVGLLGISCGLLFLMAPRARTWILRRQFRRRADRGQMVERIFTDDWWECKVGDLQSSKTSWQLVEKCVETPTGFLLYFGGKTIFSWVPVDGFVRSDEVQQFTELTRTKVAEYRVIAYRGRQDRSC
jgi:hypothetical protein